MKKIKNFHFILQGKGGVGKTTVSSFITQYLKDELKKDYLAIDTDQVNASFASFNELGVEALNIMENNQIIPRGWDTLIEKLINTEKSNIIIDNGASSFVPLIAYSIENDIIELLTSTDNDFDGNIFIHVIIAGGEGLSHTLSGLDIICNNFNSEKVQIVVWLNSFLGVIEDDGLKFEQMEIFKKHKKRIFGVVQIPQYSADTFGKDISDMLSKNRTFKEVVNSPSVSIAARHRLKKAQRSIFELLNQISIIFEEE